MVRPPISVAVVMDCVMMLLDKPTGWANAKAQISENNFIRSMVDLDVSQIPQDVLEKIDIASFTPKMLMEQSKAAALMYMWVSAVMKLRKPAKQIP